MKMTLSMILIITGVICYILNVILIRYFIKKNDPVSWRYKNIKIGHKNAWEHTANKGITPKWVSLIGIFGINCFIVGVILEIVALF